MPENKHIQSLEKTIEALEDEIRQLRYNEKINKTLLDITNAVNTTPNLSDLYCSIHQSLSSLMPLPNIYISLYDKDKGILQFPYARDEVDMDSYRDISLFNENSLTGEVILTKSPLFLDSEPLLVRMEQGRVLGTVPKIWLGVPLMIGELVIGVLAIQHYTNPLAYTRDDLHVLIQVSHQIALAIERKRLNEALKENEERYRNLAEKSHDIIMRFDRSLRHLYVNPAIARIGYSEDQFLGKTHRELGFPEDLVVLWEDAIRKVFQTGQLMRIEFCLPTGLWIDWLLCPEFDSQGEVKTVISFARDITQRKRKEFESACYDRINKIIINSEDLEKMLNDILDAMLDIFQCDRAWILYPCDPEAEFYMMPFMRYQPNWPLKAGYSVKITNETRELLKEIITSEEPIVYDPVTQKPIRQYIKDTYFVRSQMVTALFPRTGNAWEIGLHQCTCERIWSKEDQALFKGICRRVADGLSSMILFRELSEAKHYIENVIDSMPSILIGVDISGKITQWNYKAETETGISADDAAGQDFFQFFPHLGKLAEKIRTAIETSEVMEETKLSRVFQGKTKYENLTVFPLKELLEKGAVIRIDDVTEKARIEEMMVQSEKMLSVGGLAAGMAHEINNPLAGMMQNAQVLVNRLSRDLPENEKIAMEVGTTMQTIKDYMEKRKIFVQLDHINEAGKHAAKIIQNLLSFAKKAEGLRTFENLPQLMDRTIDLAGNDYELKKKCDFRQIKINRAVEADFPLVQCDPAKIQQVFFNIIKNAAEAMHDSDKSRVPQPELRLRFFVKDRMAVIEIQDNGPGIEKETRSRIFEPFFTTKSPDRGKGLGLSVAFFIIVEDHKGELGVESSSESGSTFIIRLPLCD